MKSPFLPAFLLCALALPCAAQQADQKPAETTPNAAAQSKYSENNLRALAAVGAFYEKLRTAPTYQGDIRATKTTKNGKTVSKKQLDVTSYIVGDGDGHVAKEIETIVYDATTGEGENASSDLAAFEIVNDGQLAHRTSITKRVWSEEPWDKQETMVPLTMATIAMSFTAQAIDQGAQFENPVLQDHDTLRLLNSTSGNVKMVYEVHLGLLRSIEFTSDEETTRIEWNDIRLDRPIDSKYFVWHQRENYKQVSPEESKVNVVF